ncbi:helicase C-terminal domain-containing protein [Methanosarcina sp.]|uniref:helicase C-terminal domain-containing protein n=1 Tax=Methanosarcina sp. TaxID=2213 RepID=UPI003BB744B5
MDIVRQEQNEMLKGIADALDSGKRYIMVEAPTGSGKSPVSIALCKYFQSGYICTDQKSLQNQYLRDFKGSVVQSIGRSNFVCKQASMNKEPDEEIYCNRGLCTSKDNFQCAGCPIVEEEATVEGNPRFAAISASRGPLFWKKNATPENKCNYWLHKTKALNSDIVVNNYAYLLTEGNFVGDFGKRNILVSDEGHNIEKHIMNFVTVSITEKTLEAFDDIIFPYIVDDTLRTRDQIKHGQEKLMPLWINWLRELYGMFPKRMQELSELKSFVFNSKEGMGDKECPFKIPKSCEGKTKEEVLEILLKMIEKLELLSWTISFFLGDCSKNPENWVIQPEQEGPKIIKGEFKPVRINKFAKEKYFQFGEINVIMSATIIDFECMAKDLGLLPEEYATIKIPPVFPKESNKLYHLRVCNLNYENTREYKDYEKNMLVVVEFIDLILKKFPEQKGIIHCNTYKNMLFINKHSKYADRILGHTPENREAVLKKHEENKIPSVLCSPSMSEGVDLKFDTSRFQIIVKVPYPFLGDIQIKERKKQDPQFYINRTALYLVQAIGRSVRDKEDWAYTFTIDSRFPDFCYSNSNIMENFNRHERPALEVLDLLY